MADLVSKKNPDDGVDVRIFFILFFSRNPANPDVAGVAWIFFGEGWSFFSREVEGNGKIPL